MRISDWSSDVCSSDLGFDQASAQRLVAARTQRPFVDVEDLVARAALDKPACEALARGNALRRLAGHRHRAFWAVAGAQPPPPVLHGARTHEVQPSLPLPSIASDVFADYASTGLSLRSEEHTSELQSLMRISYAVFCMQN